MARSSINLLTEYVAGQFALAWPRDLVGADDFDCYESVVADAVAIVKFPGLTHVHAGNGVQAKVRALGLSAELLLEYATSAVLGTERDSRAIDLAIKMSYEAGRARPTKSRAK